MKTAFPPTEFNYRDTYLAPRALRRYYIIDRWTLNLSAFRSRLGKRVKTNLVLGRSGKKNSQRLKVNLLRN